jgi:hypothetical protein
MEPLQRRKTAQEDIMYCSMSTVYAALLTPDIDQDDMRFGQLLVMAAGLSIVVVANAVAFLISAIPA